MARRALILTAGTLISIATYPLTAAAISPQQNSPVTNNQAQLADVIADQTLNVVDVSDATTQSVVADGNTFTGSIIGSPLTPNHPPSQTGNASATGRVNVTTNSGSLTTINVATTGNDSESNVLSGGTLTGTSNQT